MNLKEQKLNDVVYDSQFKQKLAAQYFPFTWQGLFLLFICWILPINVMSAGGIYLFFGFIIYRMFIVKKDHEIEMVTIFEFIVTFLKWIEKNRESEHVVF